MTVCVEPVYEATVSPGLISFLRGEVGTQAAIEQDPNSESQENQSASDDVAQDFRVGEDPSALSSTDGFRKTVLRQDGTRPLTLMGMCVWEDEVEVCEPSDEARSISRTIGLYLSDTMDVAAQVSFVPSQALSARPIYRAAWIPDEASFARFLLSNVPELCFAAAPDAAVKCPDLCALLDLGQCAHRPEALCLSDID